MRQWPLPEGSFQITSRFAGRTNPVTGLPENHSGVDMAVPDGTPFYAPAGGYIKYLGPASGYGVWIVIDHPDSEGGGCSEFGHLWSNLPGQAVGQWVERGQHIGNVGSNGQSTGPHLHMTVHSYDYSSPRVDPETWLSGCPYPPAGGGPATGTAPEGGSMSTLFGIDVSEFQDGLNLSGTGMDFVIIRLAYGASKADRCAVSHTQDWATTGKPVSFYHYLTPWDSIDSQADLVKRMWDACGQRGGVWIDVEEPGITRSQVVGFRDALRSRGVLVIGAYSRANFWEALPGGEPTAAEGGGAIWVSHYGQQPAGPIRSIYPGDSSSQWSYPLGNRKPDLWQWTDRATVPGWTSGVDANAYRGSVDQLRALFTGGEAATTSEEDDMFTDDDRAALLDCRAMLQTLCAQDMGDPGVTGPYGGWPHDQIMASVREKLAAGKDLTRTEQLHALADKAGIYKEK